MKFAVSPVMHKAAPLAPARRAGGVLEPPGVAVLVSLGSLATPLTAAQARARPAAILLTAVAV
jgi:hypothetical protein